MAPLRIFGHVPWNSLPSHFSTSSSSLSVAVSNSVDSSATIDLPPSPSPLLFYSEWSDSSAQLQYSLLISTGSSSVEFNLGQLVLLPRNRPVLLFWESSSGDNSGFLAEPAVADPGGLSEPVRAVVVVCDLAPLRPNGMNSFGYRYKSLKKDMDTGDVVGYALGGSLYAGLGAVVRDPDGVNLQTTIHAGVVLKAPNPWTGAVNLFIAELTANSDGFIDAFNDEKGPGIRIFRFDERIHQYHGASQIIWYHPTAQLKLAKRKQISEWVFSLHESPSEYLASMLQRHTLLAAAADRVASSTPPGAAGPPASYDMLGLEFVRDALAQAYEVMPEVESGAKVLHGIDATLAALEYESSPLRVEDGTGDPIDDASATALPAQKRDKLATPDGKRALMSAKSSAALRRAATSTPTVAEPSSPELVQPPPLALPPRDPLPQPVEDTPITPPPRQVGSAKSGPPPSRLGRMGNSPMSQSMDARGFEQRRSTISAASIGRAGSLASMPVLPPRGTDAPLLPPRAADSPNPQLPPRGGGGEAAAPVVARKKSSSDLAVLESPGAPGSSQPPPDQGATASARGAAGMKMDRRTTMLSLGTIGGGVGASGAAGAEGGGRRSQLAHLKSKWGASRKMMRNLGRDFDDSAPEQSIEMILTQMRNAEGGLPIADIPFNGKLHRKVFLGCDMVDWLLKKQFVKVRTEGVDLCGEFIAAGKMYPVTRRGGFADGMELFKFAVDDENAYYVPGIFDATLAETVAMQRPLLPKMHVPVFLEICMHQVRASNGFTAQGIFRLAATMTSVDAAKADCNDGRYESVLAADDPHVVACLLKLWLRSLREPVIPSDRYLEVVQRTTSTDSPEARSSFAMSLPAENRAVIYKLMAFLAELAQPQYVEATKMDVKNLATVFTPCLLRSTATNPLEAMMFLPAETNFVVSLIQDFVSAVGFSEAGRSVAGQSFDFATKTAVDR